MTVVDHARVSVPEEPVMLDQQQVGAEARCSLEHLERRGHGEGDARDIVPARPPAARAARSRGSARSPASPIEEREDLVSGCGHRMTSLAAARQPVKPTSGTTSATSANEAGASPRPEIARRISASGHAAIHEIAAGTGAIWIEGARGSGDREPRDHERPRDRQRLRQRPALTVGAPAHRRETDPGRPCPARSRAWPCAWRARRLEASRGEPAERADAQRLARLSRAIPGRRRPGGGCPFTKKLGVPATPLRSAASVCRARCARRTRCGGARARSAPGVESELLGVARRDPVGCSASWCSKSRSCISQEAPLLARRLGGLGLRARRGGARPGAAGGGRRSGSRRRTPRAGHAGRARRGRSTGTRSRRTRRSSRQRPRGRGCGRGPGSTGHGQVDDDLRRLGQLAGADPPPGSSRGCGTGASPVSEAPTAAASTPSLASASACRGTPGSRSAGRP